MLWRNVSVEIYPTSINMSSDHFIMTVSITSLEKSLIVCIEPESPLLMTLYLGFQYQPNHTHFNLNITLPKNQMRNVQGCWLQRVCSMGAAPTTQQLC